MIWQSSSNVYNKNIYWQAVGEPGQHVFTAKHATLAPHAHLSRAQVPWSAGEIAKKTS
jgi:hypothetical protein